MAGWQVASEIFRIHYRPKYGTFRCIQQRYIVITAVLLGFGVKIIVRSIFSKCIKFWKPCIFIAISGKKAKCERLWFSVMFLSYQFVIHKYLIYVNILFDLYYIHTYNILMMYVYTTYIRTYIHNIMGMCIYDIYLFYFIFRNTKIKVSLYAHAPLCT